jgi:hypothetical protein
VRNVKAETMAEAHRERVESEAHTYLRSETRKAEAHAASAQVTQQTTMMSGSRIPGTKEEESKLCVSMSLCRCLSCSESEKQMKKKQNPRSSPLSLSIVC